MALSGFLVPFASGALIKRQEIADEYDETAGEIIPGDRPQRMSAVMYDSPERSIQFVAEKTGLDIGRAKAAVVEKMNEAYPAGSPKRATMDDDDMIKAYLDNNLGIAYHNLNEQNVAIENYKKAINWPFYILFQWNYIKI